MKPLSLFAALATPAAARGEAIAYALLRATYGAIMVTHGLPKLLGQAHGSMGDPMAASTRLIDEVLRLPFPGTFALMVALLEGLGGLMLAVGLATRVVAALMAIQMLAIVYILAPTWAWIDRGIEYPLLMLVLSLYLVLRGPGVHSLDSRLATPSLKAQSVSVTQSSKGVSP
ncbi:DoxX family protein [Stutzerimonas nosocomialis]|uniref:DoxX family protein n=1 Tax=Stutzerimonas nosocomialis TaxID=1056496 RepID=A0A5R9QDE8_9GAMM|nr:DoxX family protein [Stutzerimonas nosocomialis]TLX63149.1 DoxX family protein [Stutzerimonas nosocomialis]